MKARTDLSLSRTAKGTKGTKGTTAGKNAQGRNATSWEQRITSLEKQSAVKLGLQAAKRGSDERTARVEALRAQVKAGTYQMNSHVLAEKILLHGRSLFNDEWS